MNTAKPKMTEPPSPGTHVTASAQRFRVSTGLKRVLGRELITNDEVAIFELVKNSFDAAATQVYIHFDLDAITIADNGCGMSEDDLQNKWLFVAYSSKRLADQTSKNAGFRDVATDRQHYAGSKGIGRFSSDRLGRYLQLQTRPTAASTGTVHTLGIDWSMFEQNDQTQFSNVILDYREATQFELPSGLPAVTHGTVITISELTKRWNRETILALRSALAKLINPFGATTDDFRITVVAEHESAKDHELVEAAKQKDTNLDQTYVPCVNGEVGNFVFSTLKQKTTYLEVNVNSANNTIETSLTDRGELIYRIREPNRYPLLQHAEFRCELYSLNRAAKATFARRMGVPSVQFGSVFLFRNGFRVFPIGESDDDWFGIDRRKQQGYARYLGTRDVIGRIEVSGSDELFQEASSRNQGLIVTPAVAELRDCFREHCLKRLERYVVPVSWGTKDIDSETLAFLESDSGRARVSAALADLLGGESVEVLNYSSRLIDILNERSDRFQTSIADLKLIASRAGDDNLLARINVAEQRFEELRRSEAEARRIANEEHQAKLAAESLAAAATADAEDARAALGEERKRNLFLASVTSLDVETILDMHHLVTIYAVDLQKQIELLMLRLGDHGEVSKSLIIDSLEPMSLLSKKVLAVAKFATKANFRIESECIDEDLADYMVSYVQDVAKNFLAGRIAIDISTDGKVLKRKFKPIEVAIVIDNLISNARKAKATRLTLDFRQTRKGLLEILVRDDGRGIPTSAISEGQLFEKGFTTTDGSGLGLYHVRQVLGEMGGSIEVVTTEHPGAAFLMKVPS